MALTYFMGWVMKLSDGRSFVPIPLFFPRNSARFYWQMAGADGQLRLSFTPSCKIWYLRSYVPTSIFFVVRDRREPSKRIPGVIPFLEQAHGA